MAARILTTFFQMWAALSVFVLATWLPSVPGRASIHDDVVFHLEDFVTSGCMDKPASEEFGLSYKCLV